MAFDLRSLATNLLQDVNGIWRARGYSPVSYPDEHHDACFALEDRSFWFRHRANCVLQAIRSFPPVSVIFDVGGGNGYMTEAMNKAGFPSILLEPGEKGVRNASRRGLAPIIAATLEGAGFPSHAIPAIGLFDVVEHVDDDARFLRSINESLATGGRLYLTVPAYRALWSNEDLDAGHFRRYRLSELTQKLQAAGFDVLYQTYIFSLLPVPIFLLRTIPYWLGMTSARKPERQLKEHGADASGRGAMLERTFRWELSCLAERRSIPFGGSCLAVATPKAHR